MKALHYSQEKCILCISFSFIVIVWGLGPGCYPVPLVGHTLEEDNHSQTFSDIIFYARFKIQIQPLSSQVTKPGMDYLQTRSSCSFPGWLKHAVLSNWLLTRGMVSEKFKGISLSTSHDHCVPFFKSLNFIRKQGSHGLSYLMRKQVVKAFLLLSDIRV